MCFQKSVALSTIVSLATKGLPAAARRDWFRFRSAHVNCLKAICDRIDSCQSQIVFSVAAAAYSTFVLAGCLRKCVLTIHDYATVS